MENLVSLACLYVDAFKHAYDRAGIDFYAIPEQERIDMIYDFMLRTLNV